MARRLAEELQIDPGLSSKYLLYGARGGGKSTQMHELRALLAAEFEVVDIDLDRSGVAITGITAFDLMYVIGVATLRLVRDKAERDRLHDGLTAAYASDDDERKALGGVDQALDGIAGFGDAAIAGVLAVGAVAVGAATGPAALAVAGVKAVKHVLRLRSSARDAREVVPATSPPGRQMQDAVEAAFASARNATGRYLAVLLDGLEKINGGAAQWMRDTFENTRLLTDTSVTMVVAAPPCPFTDTNSAGDLGWHPYPIYGFAPDDLPSLEEALQRRIRAAGLDADDLGVPALCMRLATESGGHPRHAIQLLHTCAAGALVARREQFTSDDVSAAVTKLREQLEMGLVEPSYEALDAVDRHHRLPGVDPAHRLFSDGRILVHPPTSTMAHSFHVHPLLARAVEQYRASGGAGDA